MDGKIIEDSIYNYQTSFWSNHATHLQRIKIKPTEEQLKLETNIGGYCVYSFRTVAERPVLQTNNLMNNFSSQSAISSPRSSVPSASNIIERKQSQKERKSPTR